MIPWHKLTGSIHRDCWFWETDQWHRFVWVTETAAPGHEAPVIWRQGTDQEEFSSLSADQDQQTKHRENLRNREPFHDFVARIPHPDGPRAITFSGAPFSDHQGDFRGYRGTVHNAIGESGSHHRHASTLDEMTVTERRLSEELSQVRSRFMDFAESASDWFWETDGQHRFTFISETFELITGLSRTECIGETLPSLATSTGLNREAWEAHLADLENRRSFRNFCFAHLRRDEEEVWISVNGRPILDSAGNFTGYRGSCKDITQQIALEKALRGALVEAEAANAAKSGFLSSMSHELRTPLNGVLGFGQLLKMDEENPLIPMQMEAVDQILNCGNHLLTLIEDVLDLSRIDQRQLVMEITEVNPASIVHESLAMIRNQINKTGLDLQTVGLDGLVDHLVLADLGRAKQILLNLLTNAFKYNPDGTFIKLACSIQKGVYMRFAVSDDGPGIAKEMQKYLFQPFNRLGMEAKNIEGTGIGLTISKELIELMGGNIGFESEKGKGSRFWFDLPLAALSQSAMAAQSIPQILRNNPALDTQPRRKILYIEDNPAYMMLMTMVVNRLENAELIPAETAETGLEIAAEEVPDLILMDINLPGMNGIEALRELRSVPKLRKIPVIAVSAAAMPSDIEAGAKAGFDRYLTKPIQIDDALQAIGKVLGQSIPTINGQSDAETF
jgi:PAS domain S-box-containing protein